MRARGLRRPDLRRGVQLLVALIGVFIAVNAHWIWAYRWRYGMALDIDEAGYFSYTLIDYFGLHFGGLQGWLAAVDMQSAQAPLTMAVASLLFGLAGPHIVLGFAVPLAAGAGCVAAAYGLGASLGSARAGLLAAVLTASCPVIVLYARSYLFAVPAAFFAIMALLAMVRSRNFNSIGWALGFGCCLGLLPLARTMTLAFIPGLIVAALVSVIAEPAGRITRLLKLGLSLLAGFLLALPWFWKNGALVAQYLFSYGYGGHALAYGAEQSVFSLPAVLLRLNFYINAETHLPEGLIICLGLLALVMAGVEAVAEAGLRRAACRAFKTPLLPVIIFNVATLLALFSSGNRGSGFLAPVIPPLMVQTAWSLCRLRGPLPLRAGVYGLSLAAALVTFVPLAGLNPLARPWSVNLPGLGPVTLTNGLGNIQRYEFEYGYGRPAELQLDRKASAAWVQLSVATAMQLARRYGPQANVMFGFRNALVNVNTVNLQDLRAFHAAFAVQQIDPVETGMSEAGYRDWLVKDGAAACALLTSNARKGDFDPQVDPGLMQAAAVQAGFVPVTAWPAPDGQLITLWRHPAAIRGCADR
jgi:4-amino-4-deoxy-L-arabinose transferase-like glycosyltransferase